MKGVIVVGVKEIVVGVKEVEQGKHERPWPLRRKSSAAAATAAEGTAAAAAVGRTAAVVAAAAEKAAAAAAEETAAAVRETAAAATAGSTAVAAVSAAETAAAGRGGRGGKSPWATTTTAHSSTSTRGTSGSGATRTTTATTSTATSAPSTTPSAAGATTLGARLRDIEGGGGGVSGGEVDNWGAELDLLRHEVEEQTMDLHRIGKGSLASGKATGYLLHAPDIVSCAVVGGKGNGEVLLEQNADRADVATLEHRLELGPNQVSAHLVSLEAAHKGVGECTEEDGAGAVVGSGPGDAVGDVSRHGGVVLSNRLQASGTL
ncbi:unnamed protein product [Closterium sp. NIES-54]